MQHHKSLPLLLDPTAKGSKDGDKVGKKDRDNGKVGPEGRFKVYKEDSSTAQRYMRMGRIYLLRKRGLVVRF